MPSERMSADTTEVSHHAAAASITKLSVTISPLMRAVVDLNWLISRELPYQVHPNRASS
jgi:hypothetical protein